MGDRGSGRADCNDRSELRRRFGGGESVSTPSAMRSLGRVARDDRRDIDARASGEEVATALSENGVKACVEREGN